MSCVLFCSSCIDNHSVEIANESKCFSYSNEELGFSLTLETITSEEVESETRDGKVSFFHAPSRKEYGGLICTIEVVSPKSDFFEKGYDDITRSIIAMGEDRVFLLKSPGGGANTGTPYLEDFRNVAESFSVENLRSKLCPTHAESIPVLSRERHRAYLPLTDGNFIHPDAFLSRGELAQMLFNLLDADNKDSVCSAYFPDVIGLPCEQAIAYLASYGILSGYDDGMFRPEVPVSRAAFAVLLHRIQFAAPIGLYGDSATFADVSDTYWAYEYITSAVLLEWMNGQDDGKFHPEGEITRAQAVTTINRLLGRDESATLLTTSENPFRDLNDNHWAYGNLLEATGVLVEPDVRGGIIPSQANVCVYMDSEVGWCVNDSQLMHTVDGGKHWTSIGEQLPCAVSDLYFFDEEFGILLGETSDRPLVLLYTSDGGITWADILADARAVDLHLPTRQITNREQLLQNVISADFRYTGNQSVYLTVQYVPYESIYTPSIQATKQSLITIEEIVKIMEENYDP